MDPYREMLKFGKSRKVVSAEYLQVRKLGRTKPGVRRRKHFLTAGMSHPLQLFNGSLY